MPYFNESKNLWRLVSPTLPRDQWLIVPEIAVLSDMSVQKVGLAIGFARRLGLVEERVRIVRRGCRNKQKRLSEYRLKRWPAFGE